MSRVLDFKRVKDKERIEAKALFKTKEGKTQLKDISRWGNCSHCALDHSTPPNLSMHGMENCYLVMKK